MIFVRSGYYVDYVFNRVNLLLLIVQLYIDFYVFDVLAVRLLVIDSDLLRCFV